MTKRIFPSLLGANPLSLSKTIENLDSLCPGYHIDMMDFHCVTNLGIGIHTASATIEQSAAPYHWVHCMTERGADVMQSLIEQLPQKRRLMASIHIECEDSMQTSINSLNELSVDVGIAIKPKTDLRRIEEYLHLIHHVLIMSVNPGHSGRPFIESAIDKVFQLTQTRKQLQLSFRIGVDGGITRNNIQKLTRAGADDFAIASGIFNTNNPIQELKRLNALLLGEV